jgi:hypothetical protein
MVRRVLPVSGWTNSISALIASSLVQCASGLQNILPHQQATQRYKSHWDPLSGQQPFAHVISGSGNCFTGDLLWNRHGQQRPCKVVLPSHARSTCSLMMVLLGGAWVYAVLTAAELYMYFTRLTSY